MTSCRRQAPSIITKIPHLEAPDRALILGGSGTGKSTCGKNLLEREGNRWPIIAWDPDDETSQKGAPRAEVVLGPLRHRVTWDEFLDLPEGELDDPRLSLSVVPDADADEAAEQFAEFVSVVEATGDLLVYVEEVGQFRRHACARKALVHLATRSRKWGVKRGTPIVMLAQRAFMVDIDARSQAGIIECFKQIEDSDLKALADRCGKEFAERARALPRGESLLWAPNHQTSR